MNHPENFRLVLFFGMLGSMFLLETFWSARPWDTTRWKRWVFHGGLSIFNTIFTRLLLVGPLLVWLHFVREQGWGLSQVFGLSGFGEIVATIVVLDCFDYWWHRFNHLVPFLWRFHRVHHMDTHVDVTTALRFHPIELALSSLAKSTWILVWGPSLVAFLIFEAGITTYSLFHHSSIDLPDKVEKFVRLIHMTPRVHASHHTVSMRTRDANYSTIFLVWDRLFRTFQEPAYEEIKKLGLPEGRETYMSFKRLLLTPFISSKG